MKKIICRLTLWLFLGGLHTAYAQVSSYYEEPRLYVGSSATVGSAVEVSYETTTAGFVELRLTDDKGKVVWIKGVVKPKGKHVFKIPTEPMEKNIRYEFVLKFKGKDESGWFYSPAT